jgi:chromate transporter
MSRKNDLVIRALNVTSPSEGSRDRIVEVVRYFLRLGLLGFGGPVALVGQMGRELADERVG